MERSLVDARAPPHRGQSGAGGEAPGDHPGQPADEDPHARHPDRSVRLVGRRPAGSLGDQGAPRLHRLDRIFPGPRHASIGRHPWPGNIRELQSVLKQCSCGAGSLYSSPTSCRPRSGGRKVPSEPLRGPLRLGGLPRRSPPRGLAGPVCRVARGDGAVLLSRRARHTGGNQVQAAKLLGITRGSLRTKIRTLGIQIGRSVWSPADQSGL